jgi:hypothetical protein
MRYRLRTLLILLVVLPPVAALVFGATVDGSLETIERRSLFLITLWFGSIVATIFFDWQRGRAVLRRRG